jgi:flavin reductase (DIM6/NTAB) family NADH-FMN oxidoreductase RutF/pimeloyl-ACP methyl ester carboxylesterase
MMSRTLRLSDGAAVRVIEAGQGAPLLLIHGVGMRAEAWGPQIEALSDRARVIAVDMPGHGESDLLAGEPRLPDYVAWAARVIEALGLGPVSVAGHSMGALIVGGLAVTRPDLVARAALLNGVHRRDASARAAVLARAAEIAAGGGSIEAPLARWFTADEAATRDQVAGWLQSVPQAGYAAAYRAFAEGDATYADRYAEIRAPLLVLTADGDPNSTPEMTRAMAAAAPRGEAVVIEGHRHMVNLTAPQAVTDRLAAWLQTEVPMTPAPLDRRALRDAFGCFMTGVTVVTTTDEAGKPLGFTANSFSSVSLDPPMLLVSIANSSSNLAAFSQGGFAVNILAEGQKDVSATFAKPATDRFASVYWRKGPVGAPLIAGVSAWFDCTLEQAVLAGDHTILIGRIGAFESTAHPGLGYYRGAYMTPATTSGQIPAGPDVVVSAVFEKDRKVLLIDDGRGGLSVPMARVGREGVQAALARLSAEIGVSAEGGSVYAVYEDARLGSQHIALRCPTNTEVPLKGVFVELSPEGMGDVTDPALRQMLVRLAEEARMGNYGVYFGTHEQGRVQRIAEEPKR